MGIELTATQPPPSHPDYCLSLSQLLWHLKTHRPTGQGLCLQEQVPLTPNVDVVVLFRFPSNICSLTSVATCVRSLSVCKLKHSHAWTQPWHLVGSLSLPGSLPFSLKIFKPIKSKTNMNGMPQCPRGNTYQRSATYFSVRGKIKRAVSLDWLKGVGWGEVGCV